MHRAPGILAIAVTVTLVGPGGYALEPGEPIGPVKLETLSGERIVMDKYDERPGTGVVFLSARCPVTEQAIGAINRLHRKYRLRGVLFVGVCSNPAESGEELRRFGQRRGVIFPMYRDPAGEVAKHFGATATPELFLLDRAGKLLFHGGLGSEPARDAAETAMKAILSGKSNKETSYAVAGTPIDKPGPKRAIDDPYGTISFSSELVFEKIPQAVAYHCSTLCETGGGDLLCLWYGGSYESADDQALYLARRKAGERTWSEPRVLVQNEVRPPGNGVIFRDPSDRLWIVWGRMEGSRPTRRGSGWRRCRLMVRTSSDDGLTWSDDRTMFDETLWCVPRNPPARLANETLLLPVEGSLDDVEGSHFLTLAPGSATWRRAAFTSGGSQPAVIERKDGSLLALMRHARYITQIESRDGGQTWTDAKPTPLKNPDAGITMTKLANGHLVLVFNDSQTRRTPLCIARSTDEGKTWEKPLNLESNPGEYSYPCVIQSADGKIHISYTFRRYAIKHVELNENWLEHLDRPN